MADISKVTLLDNQTYNIKDENAVPNTRTINNKQLNENIALNASDVGALSEEDAYPLKSAVENNGIGYFKRVSSLAKGMIYGSDWETIDVSATEKLATIYDAVAELQVGRTYKVTINGTETIATCEYLDEPDMKGLRLDAPDADVVRVINFRYSGEVLRYEIRVYGDFEPPELMRIEVALSGGTRTVIGDSTAHPSDWELGWTGDFYYCVFVNEEYQPDPIDNHIIATVNGIRKDLYMSYIDWMDLYGFDIGDGLYLLLDWQSIGLCAKEIPDYDITFSVDAIDDFTLVTSKINSEFIDGQSISYPTASTSNWGITRLVDSVSSTAINMAATPNAVKQAYDRAVQADGARVTAGQKSGTSLGTDATAEGYNNTASGSYSHSEGYYTTAQRRSQHTFGEYNILDTTGTITTRGSYVEIVGNGTATDARSNARTLDWNGNEVLAGKLTVGTAPTANMDVATKKYVDDNIPTVPTNVSSFTNDAGYLTLATLPIYDGTVI